MADRTMLISLLFVCLPAAPLDAQEGVTILLRSHGLAGEEVRLIESDLKGLLDQAPGILASVPAPPADAGDFELSARRAEDLLSQAQERYRKFDEPGTRESLGALKDVLREGCAVSDRAVLRGYHLIRGLAHFVAGRRDDAWQAFTDLTGVDPAWEPDPKEFAPKVVAAMSEARAAVLTRQPGVVEVDGRPTGARVLLDGADVGSLPLVLDRLPPGGHCLRLRAAGFSSFEKSFTLAEGGSIRLRVSLFPDSARSLLALEGVPPGIDPGEAARWFGTDYLALADAREQSVRLVVVAAATSRVGKPVECPRSGDRSAVVRCLQAGILQSVEVLRPPPVPVAALGDVGRRTEPVPAPVVEAEPAWYERWWVWAIVGGIALTGAGAGLLLGLQDGGSGEIGPYRVIVSR